MSIHGYQNLLINFSSFIFFTKHINKILNLATSYIRSGFQMLGWPRSPATITNSYSTYNRVIEHVAASSNIIPRQKKIQTTSKHIIEMVTQLRPEEKGNETIINTLQSELKWLKRMQYRSDLTLNEHAFIVNAIDNFNNSWLNIAEIANFVVETVKKIQQGETSSQEEISTLMKGYYFLQAKKTQPHLTLFEKVLIQNAFANFNDIWMGREKKIVKLIQHVFSTIKQLREGKNLTEKEMATFEKECNWLRRMSNRQDLNTNEVAFIQNALANFQEYWIVTKKNLSPEIPPHLAELINTEVLSMNIENPPVYLEKPISPSKKTSKPSSNSTPTNPKEPTPTSTNDSKKSLGNQQAINSFKPNKSELEAPAEELILNAEEPISTIIGTLPVDNPTTNKLQDSPSKKVNKESKSTNKNSKEPALITPKKLKKSTKKLTSRHTFLTGKKAKQTLDKQVIKNFKPNKNKSYEKLNYNEIQQEKEKASAILKKFKKYSWKLSQEELETWFIGHLLFGNKNVNKNNSNKELIFFGGEKDWVKKLIQDRKDDDLKYLLRYIVR